jgi:DNA-binding NarL/FixJ family response regulator
MKQTTAQKIKVLLVDDHPIVREGLKSHLSAIEQLRIVGEATDGREAIEKTRRLAPDVVLMDISLPRMNGLEATRALQEQAPQTRVIALSMHDNKEYVQEIIRCGARGYILKTASPFDLVRAIEAVHRGDTFFSPEISQTILNEYVHRQRRGAEAGESRLSAREEEVVLLIAEGLTNKEIAAR